MRQLLLVFFIVTACVCFSFSQIISKGTTMVGGNAGFQFKSNNEQTTEFAFSTTPYAMHSVIKQLALGGQLSYTYYFKKIKGSNPNTFSDNAFTIGPALRANFFIGGKTYLFIHGSPSFGVNVQRDPSDRDEPYYSNSVIAWRAGPGFSIFAAKNMAVEFGFYYDGVKEVGAIKQRKAVLVKDAPVFTHGLTVAIGLQFYAHKKSKQLQPVDTGK